MLGSKKKSQEKRVKITHTELNWKYSLSNFIGCSKNILQRKFITLQAHIRKWSLYEINNLNLELPSREIRERKNRNWKQGEENKQQKLKDKSMELKIGKQQEQNQIHNLVY